jgi:hypothetical protein
VTTRSQEKLATAKVSAPCSTSIEVQSVEHVQPVVPMKQDNKAAATISSVPKSDVVTAVVGKDVVEEAEPLNELNMQLKRVSGDACRPADRCQHWSLFQTQCMIKGKACKLMVDGGSYCNGISKVVMTTLGLSTWRIPEPKHVAWLNSCGMPQSEEHDARSISVAIVSAMSVDDKPVVLVSDKPVEVKPLIDERKNIAACSIVCADKGVQTDAPLC